MNWDRYTYDKYSSWACGKGLVIQHCWQEDDDWNRSNSGYTGIDIDCTVCASKYHIQTVTRHYQCHSWEGNGVSKTFYLVPNGERIPSVISRKYDFAETYDEIIVSKFTKQEIQDVILDM